MTFETISSILNILSCICFLRSAYRYDKKSQKLVDIEIQFWKEHDTRR